MLNDIEHSISAVDQAFAAMEGLSREVGVSEADWKARRSVLEKSLVRPLRTYRSQLLPHHRRQQRKTKQLFEKATAVP